MNNDLISREAVMKDLGYDPKQRDRVLEGSTFDIILKHHAVDAVEVVHAKWEDAGKNIHGQKLTRCSHCKGNSIEGGLFCRNCSARMDGE